MTDANVSTEASRTAALSMFDEVPCIAQLTDTGCGSPAKWLAYFTHEEDHGACEAEPVPVCDTHREVFRRVSIPFWRVWFSLDPILCAYCGASLRLDRFEPLR